MAQDNVNSTSLTEGGATQKPQPQQEDLDRVREIIFGPEVPQQRMRKTEVDRMRETLMGAQMQDYERRFADIRREMERLLTDLALLQDSVSELENGQAKISDTMEPETRRSMDDMRREVERLQGQETLVQQAIAQARQQQTVSEGLSEGVDDLRKLASQQDQEIKVLKATLSEQRDQTTRKLDTVKREMRQAEDNLHTELRRIVMRLEDEKADRRNLAAMLSEAVNFLETGSQDSKTTTSGE